MDKDILKTAVVLRHRLHRCAELSGQEKQTKATLIDFLRTHTSLELHDMGAWFYAVYKAPLNVRTESAPTRRIAFRADFDALPIEDDPALPYASENRGVAHKCGHDGHSAALCALAAEIDRHGCRSDILFLFQHAEETGCGAPVCQKMITDEKPDIIFGWHNMPGIAGLLEGLRFVEQQGVGRIAGHERHLTRHMAALLRDIPGAEVFYTPEDGAQTGVLSFRLDGWDCEALGEALAAQGAAVRAGLHCAPLAHRTAGTLPNGTVRLSVSAFTSAADIDAFAHVLRSIVRG